LWVLGVFKIKWDKIEWRVKDMLSKVKHSREV